jgi:hypothetical protein
MDRRSFLVGSGSILTTAYVDKANWFLRNRNTVVPFPEVKEAAQKLYFANSGSGWYDLRLDTPEYGFPDLTYREWLALYEDFDMPKGKPISPQNLERLLDDYGMVPDELELITANKFYYETWDLMYSPHAKAYYYLSDLDLFSEDDPNGLKMGDLDFNCPWDNFSGASLGVLSEDPLTASLLQARLIELGHNISVEITEEA